MHRLSKQYRHVTRTCYFSIARYTYCQQLRHMLLHDFYCSLHMHTQIPLRKGQPARQGSTPAPPDTFLRHTALARAAFPLNPKQWNCLAEALGPAWRVQGNAFVVENTDLEALAASETVASAIAQKLLARIADLHQDYIVKNVIIKLHGSSSSVMDFHQDRMHHTAKAIIRLPYDSTATTFLSIATCDAEWAVQLNNGDMYTGSRFEQGRTATVHTLTALAH